jgi:hypothetical protein
MSMKTDNTSFLWKPAAEPVVVWLTKPNGSRLNRLAS